MNVIITNVPFEVKSNTLTRNAFLKDFAEYLQDKEDVKNVKTAINIDADNKVSLEDYLQNK
jgi:hypothetical protein